MGRGGWNRGKGKGGRGRASNGDGDSKPKLKTVDEWNHPTKQLLKGFPDRESGTMTKAFGHASFSQLLTKGFDKWISPEWSELAARPPMGVNLGLATLECGYEALVAAANHESGTGIEKCAKLFPAEELRPLILVGQYDAEGDVDDKKEALEKFF
eukprot:5270273-Pyramimonas_sp.AAC.1